MSKIQPLILKEMSKLILVNDLFDLKILGHNPRTFNYEN